MIAELSKVATTHNEVELRKLTMQNWADLASKLPDHIKDRGIDGVIEWITGHPGGLVAGLKMVTSMSDEQLLGLTDVFGWSKALGECIAPPKDQGSENTDPGRPTGSSSVPRSNTSTSAHQ